MFEIRADSKRRICLP